MLTDEDKIRLIHECRAALLNRINELSRRPGWFAEQVSDETIATAQASTLAESDAIGSPAPAYSCSLCSRSRRQDLAQVEAMPECTDPTDSLR